MVFEEDIPQKQMLELLFPPSLDLKLAKEKNLCDGNEFSNEYLYIQAFYRKTFEHYIVNEIDLEKYNNILKESNLRFIPCDEVKQNVYQRLSKLGFEFIYLRNNIHIERLSKEDIELIKNEMKQNIMSEEELFDFIRRTQSEVLSQYDIKTGKPNELVKVGYSLDGRKIAWSNAIIFEIAHQSEFNDKGGYVDSKNEVAKYEFLENLILQMEQEFSEKLDLPVSVFLK